MRRIGLLLILLVFIVALDSSPGATSTESWCSTRVIDPNIHARADSSGYPFRAKSDYILKELDLRPGDVAVDIGAGDGWWSERMAKFVGEGGIIHAGEVAENKVSRMKEKFADVPQVKPYLCPTDSTGLPEDSCDLAFFSLVYHHLDADGRTDYLRHLHKVVKPTGRVCVIERYPEIAIKHKSHGVSLSQLVKQAEQAGWIPVRYELIAGTRHYIAFFVQRGLF
ncbi:MAG: class I SAM-dependent methyltransferase [Phycisphaerales bacterium]|nr:MAG: class I SAM-dependent methyltransferase [Phycisphaerales bacterium]